MYIHEAIQNTTKNKPFIKRRLWNRLSPAPFGGGVKIQATDSPDGCIIESDVDKKDRRSWRPTAEDLLADDWEPSL